MIIVPSSRKEIKKKDLNNLKNIGKKIKILFKKKMIFSA